MRGYGRGFGRGFRLGRGFGMGYGFGGGRSSIYGAKYEEQYVLENEKDMLLDYRDYLKSELDFVEKRLREINGYLQGGE